MDGPTHLTEPQRLLPELPSAPQRDLQPAVATPQWRRFALATGLLLLCFAAPLCALFRYAASSELYSYILLIPFISGYLVWSKWRTWPASTPPAPAGAGIFPAAGLILLIVYWSAPGFTRAWAEEDYLAVMTSSFLLFFLAICRRFWGGEALRAAAFPLGLLFFLVPIPEGIIQAFDAFLQEGSAQAAAGFFDLSGTPFLQDGLTFQLSDISLQIAPECSGIHSTLALLILSLLAGDLLLRTPWKRALLTSLVIPLSLIRNGFRVFTLGQLCIHFGPQMLDSPIHHQGGPVFFVLSLIPLWLLLVVLRKSEKERSKKSNSRMSSS